MYLDRSLIIPNYECRCFLLNITVLSVISITVIIHLVRNKPDKRSVTCNFYCLVFNGKQFSRLLGVAKTKMGKRGVLIKQGSNHNCKGLCNIPHDRHVTINIFVNLTILFRVYEYVMLRSKGSFIADSQIFPVKFLKCWTNSPYICWLQFYK